MKQILINSFVVILGLTLIILSNLKGHIDPPFSIESTPFLCLALVAFVNNPLYKQNFNITVVYNFSLLLFNDLFIRYYAGGTHDDEGKAWIALFSIMGFILALITMIIYSYSVDINAEEEGKVKARKTRVVFVFISAFITGFIYLNFISNI